MVLINLSGSPPLITKEMGVGVPFTLQKKSTRVHFSPEKGEIGKAVKEG